jgi:hypothetical protein
MNAMDCCSLNGGNVRAILRLGGGITEIIHIHLEELGGRPCSALHWGICYLHGILNVILWECNVSVHKMLRKVPGGFCHCAEMGRALYPAHLDRSRQYNPTQLSSLLGEDVGKVVDVCLLDNEAPETITDVEF